MVKEPTTFKSRLRLLIESEKLDVEDFAKAIGRSKKKRKVPMDDVALACGALVSRVTFFASLALWIVLWSC